MSKSIPKIQKYMTPHPHTIGKEQKLSIAHEFMSKHQIRHLPVLDGGKLVGILTDRDLRLVESFKDVDPKKLNVEDAMTQTSYTVSPDAPLNEVAAEMAEHKYGSAVVMQSNQVVGIFTTVDAMRALSELLETRLTH